MDDFLKILLEKKCSIRLLSLGLDQLTHRITYQRTTHATQFTGLNKFRNFAPLTGCILRKILIIDDEEKLRSLMSRVISLEGKYFRQVIARRL